MKKFLTYDEAVQLLLDYDEIHTFRQEGPTLYGCDISKKELLSRFKEAGAVIELSGEASRSMKHGIALYNKNVNYQSEILFIETSEEKLIAFEKAMKKQLKTCRIIELKIACCGDCIYYDFANHKCTLGAIEEGETSDNFYKDCPLSYRECEEATNDHNSLN